MKRPNRFPLGAICIIIGSLPFAGCQSPTTKSGTVSETLQKVPLTSFSQEITSPIQAFEVKAGGTYTLDITVKNTGTDPWVGGTGTMSVAAGYRWHDSKNNVLPIEGNRAYLVHSVVRPGDSDSLKLNVGAPPTPGSYLLWVSMLQEGIAWFFEKSSNPLILHATVT